MAVFQSLSTAVSTVRDHPTLFAIGFAYALIGQVGSLLQLTDAALSGLFVLAILLVYPFLFAGLIGAIDGALDGQTSLDRFVEAGRSNYLSLLGAFLFIGIVAGILFFFVAVAGLLISILVIGGLASSGNADGFLMGMGIVGVVFPVLAILVMLLFTMFLQFVSEAIVIDDAGAIGSLSESVGLVWQNLGSVFGFSVVIGLLSLLLQAPSQVLYYMAVEFPLGPGQQSATVTNEPLFAASVVLGVVLGTLATTLLVTFHVAFYRSIREAGDGSRDAVSSRAAV